ncbi:MAG: hypothetical protein JST47_12615 [Bacteroidetes bacterium]|nr:hypothetical protein [Bacteroidota bacterium]MBS1974703.1 hypothetical protein [Bacteroidota bacterium]
MKDIKYLLLVICFVIFAHATKDYFSDKVATKLIPYRQSTGQQKKADSLKRDASTQVKFLPVAAYN